MIGTDITHNLHSEFDLFNFIKSILVKHRSTAPVIAKYEELQRVLFLNY